MALKPPPLGEVIQQVNEIVAGNSIKGEVDKSVKSLAQAALQRLDMVSREEFDAQTEVLRRTRAKVVSLEAELEDMQRALAVPGKHDGPPLRHAVHEIVERQRHVAPQPGRADRQSQKERQRVDR